MIDFKLHILTNGLTVIAHRDPSTKMAAVNVLYKVGARNENPDRTGFAHLFEHLMFRGTTDVPDFDTPVQEACGDNNAFTNNDYTDYYMTLPKDNIETALWLEADRMTGLNITPTALETEKRVVIEEYNQRYLNQPYGDQWLLLREMAYKVHPYRWATIGQSTSHISEASLEEVREFYNRWYTPSNAILSVAADISPEHIFTLAEKWFGHIRPSHAEPSTIPQEPVQTEARRKEVTRKVPAQMITIGFKMGGRTSRQFYMGDLISDILSGGTSSRLYQRLVKARKLFSGINAYVSGDIDPGLFVVTGQLISGISPEEGEKAIWEELERISTEEPSGYELEKVKNKFEAGVRFGELNVMNKALNLGFYNMLGDMSLIGSEIEIFRAIGAAEVCEAARELFAAERSSTLIYRIENE